MYNHYTKCRGAARCGSTIIHGLSRGAVSCQRRQIAITANFLGRLIKGWKEVSPVTNRRRSHRRTMTNNSTTTNCGSFVLGTSFKELVHCINPKRLVLTSPG